MNIRNKIEALFRPSARQTESRRDDEAGATGRTSPVGEKPFRRIGLYGFLAFAVLPAVFLLALVYVDIREDLQDINAAAVSTSKVHLPGILENQRTLINIESLRRYVETVYNAFDPRVRRDAVINALSLATESVFEPDSRFAEHSGTAKSLIRSLDAVKKRSDRAEDDIHRAETLLLNSVARLCDNAGADPAARDFLSQAGRLVVHSEKRRTEAFHQDALRTLEPIFHYCGKKNGKGGLAPRDMASECDTLRAIWGDMDAAWRIHVEADKEARSLWKQLDDLLRKLSDLTSSTEAELAYQAMEYISREAERAHRTFYFSCAVIVLIFCFFVLALHHYIFSPLSLASRTLQRIRDGAAIDPLPPARVRELQDMLNMLPVVSNYVDELSSRSDLLEQEKNKFKNLSLVDGLTGVGNRRFFDMRLAELDRSHSLAMLLLDVDMFKFYNDTYGHQAGDSALIAVAQAMCKALLRSSDQVFRYGGEEFCVLLPDASEESALAVGERLRETVLALRIPHKSSTVAPYLTVSIGLALREADAAISAEELTERADKALYRAKTAGRNRVCL